EGIVDTGREAEFLFFVSFLLTFGFIRTSTHMIRAQVSWWPGNVQVGGTHIHHLVWGILLLLAFGWLVNAAKEKFGMALLGFFVPFVHPVGAIRLAKPNSLWAKLFYGKRKEKRKR